jgi:hypothetical protein
MSVALQLEDDEALVLFELLASKKLLGSVDTPERNVLCGVEALLEKQLVAPFQSDYLEQLAAARQSLVERYGA